MILVITQCIKKTFEFDQLLLNVKTIKI